MKIVFIDWASFCKEDIKTAFRNLGHQVVDFFHPDYDLRVSTEFIGTFTAYVKKEEADAIFSSNYFPLVSRVCNSLRIPYISWVYDCPHLALYSSTVINPCNHIFVFDSDVYNEFANSGITTIEYLPLAANTDRLDSMVPNADIHSKLDCDIAFVGSMYDESHNLFDRLDGLSPSARGYLDAIMESQLKISGYNFIEELLTDDILNELQRVMPYKPNPDGVETAKYIFSRFFIDRKITQIERKRLLKAVSDEFKLNLFTHNKTPYLENANNIGPIDHMTTMPYVFKCSKINLNISLRSIHKGIPLRAMDIMGAGGFLLTNYQPDFDMYFEPGVDYVYFDGEQDLISKCKYYLTHEDERIAIANNGYNKIKAHHTYMARIEYMLNKISG